MSEPSVDAMETLAGETGGSLDGREDRLPKGTLLGRYVVIAPAGAGSMGVVYAAIDPELDRKLAVKLLRVRKSGSSELMKARLLNEAKVLAKLAHPNVVAIHDVGTYEDRVWLAMEFIEGETLRQWTKTRRGRWREILDVMIAAGRGLLAAHNAGLVHRDFKPENVMVGSDSQGAAAFRVRVTDFGLASLPGDETRVASQGESGPFTGTTLDHGLVGTPAYMAPEQLRGRASGPASDQFSFCVTMWEAIHGERPFAGDSTHTIVAAVLEHRLRTPADRRAMPSWLRRILVRGLAADPDARFPSMAALLAALERGQQRRRIVRVVGLTLGIAAVPATVLAVRANDERRRERQCARAGAEISAVWPGVGASTRERIRAALHDTGPSGDAIADRMMPWLDESATRWSEARETTCRAQSVDQTWDDDMLARADACLDEQRISLEALLQALLHADAQVSYRGVSLAAGLPLADRCADATELARMPAPDRRVDEVIRMLRALEARAGNLLTAGEHEAGLLVARHQLALAEHAGLPIERTTALVVIGQQLEALAHYDEAEAVLVEAYREAGSLGAMRQVAQAADQLVFVVGSRRGHGPEGMVWAHAAEVAIAAVERTPGVLTARHLERVSQLHDEAGRFVEAVEASERSLAILEESLGAEHPRTVMQLSHLGGIMMRAGRLAEAEPLLVRALASAEQVLGDDHPHVSTCTTNLANVYLARGRADEARALYERTLGIVERVYGPRHPNVAATMMNLAQALMAAGVVEGVEPMFERALAIQEELLGREHPTVAITLLNYGAWRAEQGQWVRARELYEQALAIQTRPGMPQHPQLAGTYNNLGLVAQALGELDEAERLFERALAILDETVDRDHPVRASVLFGIGELAEQRGRLDVAIARNEEALRIRERAGVAEPEIGVVRFALARALWHRDRTHALEHAERALVELADAPDESYAARLREWLATHR